MLFVVQCVRFWWWWRDGDPDGPLRQRDNQLVAHLSRTVSVTAAVAARDSPNDAISCEDKSGHS